jgi:hypothetical protein
MSTRHDGPVRLRGGKVVYPHPRQSGLGIFAHPLAPTESGIGCAECPLPAAHPAHGDTHACA